MKLTFDFDPKQSEKNLRTYNISFEEAKHALLDPDAVTRIQPHGKDKVRYITLGKINPLEALIVIWTVRKEEVLHEDEISCKEKIRIISARPAYSFRRAHEVSRVHPLARLQEEHGIQQEKALPIDAKTSSFIGDCAKQDD